LIRGTSKFPIGATVGTIVFTTGKPFGNALQMKGVSTFSKNNGTFVSWIFDTRCHTFKGRLTNSTNIIFVSSIPSPLGNSMKAVNADAEFWFGTCMIIWKGLQSRIVVLRTWDDSRVT
jgi:hypothetical protein